MLEQFEFQCDRFFHAGQDNMHERCAPNIGSDLVGRGLDGGAGGCRAWAAGRRALGRSRPITVEKAPRALNEPVCWNSSSFSATGFSTPDRTISMTGVRRT